MGLPPLGMGTLLPVPDYSLPDLVWINEDNTLQKDDKDGWYQDQNNDLILPAILGHKLLQMACLRFPQQNATV